MILWQATLDDLRARAEQCLEGEAPTPSQARELALGVLSMIAVLEASAPEGDAAHPYRTSAFRTIASAGADKPDVAAALERELLATQERLADALRELAARKNGPKRTENGGD